VDRSLLIGVTRFFRDAEAFAALAHDIIPSLLNNKGGDQEIRVRVAGCSSGDQVVHEVLQTLETREQQVHRLRVRRWRERRRSSSGRAGT